MADSYGTYTLADIAAQVMGRDARFAARASRPLALDDEVTRYWKVDAHLSERVRAFLDLYGDGDHYIATPGRETHAITAPALDQGVGQGTNPDTDAGGTPVGVWRVVRNFEEPDNPGTVFQTLRRGWITTLVSGSAPIWTEARVAQASGGSAIPVIGASSGSWRHLVLTVVWYGIDPTKAESVAAGLRNLGAASWTPTIRGESYGSGWHRLRVDHQPAEDGSATITMLLAQAEAALDVYSNKGTTREIVSTTLYGVPNGLAQVYVDGWYRYGAAGGAGTIPLGGSVSGDLGLEGGTGTLRFSFRPDLSDFGSDDTKCWFERNSYEETASRYPEGADFMSSLGAAVSGVENVMHPAEGSYWRWVYETAIIRITTNKDIASDWANPKGTTYASTYACLPGSECRPASGGAWYSKRVVARHYTPWCVGLKRGVTAAGYAAIIAKLQGVGNLTTGKLT